MCREGGDHLGFVSEVQHKRQSLRQVKGCLELRARLLAAVSDHHLTVGVGLARAAQHGLMSARFSGLFLNFPFS